MTKAHGFVSSCIGQTIQFWEYSKSPSQHSLNTIGPIEGTRFKEYNPFSLIGHESTDPVSHTTAPVVAVGQPTNASLAGLFRYKKEDIFFITLSFNSSEASSLLVNKGDGSDGANMFTIISG